MCARKPSVTAGQSPSRAHSPSMEVQLDMRTPRLVRGVQEGQLVLCWAAHSPQTLCSRCNIGGDKDDQDSEAPRIGNEAYVDRTGRSCSWFETATSMYASHHAVASLVSHSQSVGVSM